MGEPQSALLLRKQLAGKFYKDLMRYSTCFFNVKCTFETIKGMSFTQTMVCVCVVQTHKACMFLLSNAVLAFPCGVTYSLNWPWAVMMNKEGNRNNSRD